MSPERAPRAHPDRDPLAWPPPRLGLRENAAQFTLLVVINALVGGVIGLERALLPLIAEGELGLSAHSSILSFIAIFGISKALTNYAAGRWSERVGRRRVLLAGWWVSLPVPLLLMWAPSWGWVLTANALLGVSQGLSWSMTVVMKIDLVGPARRGLAMGLNEFAGYLAVALSALATGLIAESYGLRPAPFYLGVLYVALGLTLSLQARETLPYAALEARAEGEPEPPSQRALFKRVTLTDATLSSVTQVGFINNLNDGVTWGLLPPLLLSGGRTLPEISALIALYPAVWGVGQLFTGAWSDRVGRKGLIVWGMWTQGLGLALLALTATLGGAIAGAALLGLGTAMVYPTLLAAIGDVAAPHWRASAVGIYRLWRDLGYAAGALVGGVLADLFGMSVAILAVAGLTCASGALAARRMGR
jgi:MFS family permease